MNTRLAKTLVATMVALALIMSTGLALVFYAGSEQSVYDTSTDVTVVGFVGYLNTSDNTTNAADNATVSVVFNGTTTNTTANSTGGFSVTFTNPGTEGEYQVNATATYGSDSISNAVNLTVVSYANLYVYTDKYDYAAGENVIISVAASDSKGNSVNHSFTAVTKYPNGTAYNSQSNSTGSAGLVSLTPFTLPSSYAGVMNVFINEYEAGTTFKIGTFGVTASARDSNGNEGFVFPSSSVVTLRAKTSSLSTGSGVSATVTGTIVIPGGNTTTVTFTADSSTTGVYTVNYTPTVAGDFGATISATRENETKEVTVSFRVQALVLRLNRKTQTKGLTGGMFGGGLFTYTLEAINATNRSKIIVGGQAASTLNQITAVVYKGKTAVLNVTNKSHVAGTYDLTFTAPTTAGQYKLEVTANDSGNIAKATDYFRVQSAFATLTPIDDQNKTKRIQKAGETCRFQIRAEASGNSSLTINSISLSKLLRESTDLTSNITNLTTSASDRTISYTCLTKGGPYRLEVLVNVTNGNTTEVVPTEAFYFSKLYDVFAFPSLDGTTGGNMYGGGGGYGGNFWFNSFKPTQQVKLKVEVKTATTKGFEMAAFGPAGGFGGGTPATSAGGAGGGGMFMSGGGFGQEGSNVQGVTLSVVKIFNPDTLEDVTSKVTATVSGVTGQDGTASITLQHSSQWDGGPYMVELKAVDQTGGEDLGAGFFEVRNYMVWGWAQRNGSQSNNYGYGGYFIGSTDGVNLTVSVYDPENWMGVNGVNVNVTKALYEGKPGEFVWPPKEITITPQNCTTSAGMGMSSECSVVVPAPAGGWSSGFHRFAIRATSGTTTDTGSAFFEVKNFWVQVQPQNWKFTYTPSDSIPIDVMAQYTNGTALSGATVTIDSIKKMAFPPEDVAASSYSAETATTSGTGNASITIVPTSTWDTGDYLATVKVTDASGNTDTGFIFFQVKAFYVQMQTQNWRWTFKPSEDISYNVQATKIAPWAVWGGVSLSPSDYVNVTATETQVMKWDYSTFQTSQVTNVTWSNTALPTGNGTMNLTKSGGWETGSHNVMAKFEDAAGNVEQAWGYFDVRAFQFWAWANGWSFQPGSNMSVQLNAYSADGGWMSTPYNENVTVSVSSLRRVSYSSGFSKGANNASLYTATPAVIVGNTTGQGNLTIELSGSLEEGEYVATLNATDESGNSVTTDMWFSIKAFEVYAWAVDPSTGWSAYQFSPNSNITIVANAYKANGTFGTQPINLTVSSVNVTYYSLEGGSSGTVSSSSYSTTKIFDGSNTNITLSPGSGFTWPQGDYRVYVTLADPANGQSRRVEIFFGIRPFDFYSWTQKYKHLPTDTVTPNLQVYNRGGGEVVGGNITITIESIRNQQTGTTLTQGTHYTYTPVNITSWAQMNVSLVNVPTGQYVMKLRANQTLTGLITTAEAWFEVSSFELFAMPQRPSALYSPGENITIQLMAQIEGGPGMGMQQINLTEVTRVRLEKRDGTRIDYNNANGSSYVFDAAAQTVTINTTLAAASYDVRVTGQALVGTQNMTSQSWPIQIRITNDDQISVTLYSNSSYYSSIAPHQNVSLNVSAKTSAGAGINVTVRNITLEYRQCQIGQWDWNQCTQVTMTPIDANSNVATGEAVVQVAAPNGYWPVTGWTEYNGTVQLQLSNGSFTSVQLPRFSIWGSAWVTSPMQSSYQSTETISLNVTLFGSDYSTPLTDAQAVGNVSVYRLETYSPSQGMQLLSNWSSTVGTTSNGVATVNITTTTGWPTGGINIMGTVNYTNESILYWWAWANTAEATLRLTSIQVNQTPVGIGQAFFVNLTVENPAGSPTAENVTALFDSSWMLNYGYMVNDTPLTITIGDVTAGSSASAIFNFTVAQGQNASTAIGTQSLSFKVNSNNFPNLYTWMSISINDTAQPTINLLENGSDSNSSFWVYFNFTDDTSLGTTTIKWGNSTSLGNTLNASLINSGWVGNNYQASFNTTVTDVSILPSTLYWYNITACDARSNCAETGPFNVTTAA